MSTDYHVVRPRQIVEEIIITELLFKNIEAGQALSEYDVVYQDGDLIKKAKGDSLDTMDAIGLMNNAVALGVLGDVIIRGRVENSAWSWTSGSPLFVSDSATGEMTHTPPSASGHISQHLAKALTATLIEVNPRSSYQIGQ